MNELINEIVALNYKRVKLEEQRDKIDHQLKKVNSDLTQVIHWMETKAQSLRKYLRSTNNNIESDANANANANANVEYQETGEQGLLCLL